MAKFLPGAYLFYFIGIAGALFVLTCGCFMYFKWKSYKKKMVQKKSGGNKTLTKSSRRKTKRNKFMTAKGERADEDEEGGAGESQLDAARADIDSKYNNLPTWVTDASGEPLPSPNNNNQDESTS